MDNKISLWLLVIFGPALTLSQSDIKYNIDADDIMIPMIGNMEQAHEHIRKLKKMVMVSGYATRKPKTTPKVTTVENKRIATGNNTSTTNPNDFVATRYDQMSDDNLIPFHLQTTKRPDFLKFPNLTLYDLAERLKAIEVAKIVERDTSLPNFAKEEDDPAIQTRRFDKIKSDIKDKALRVDYYYYTFRFLYKNYRAEKVMITQIMLQFIYMTRYKLEYAQRLRGKYLHAERYKIGYLFGLLRQLQREQMILYSAYHRNQFIVWALYFHMKLYEKVVRLDVDLKDVIALIRKYEYEKNTWFSDMYEDESDW